MNKFHKLNKNGFSLIEVVIAFGLLALVGLAGTSLFQLSSESTKYFDQKSSIQSLSDLIYNRLKYENSCALALGSGSGLGLTITPTIFTESLAKPYAAGSDGLEVPLIIDGIQSGVNMDQSRIDNTSNNLILGRKIKINSIKLADGVRWSHGAGHKHLVSLYLDVSDLNNRKFKPKHIMNLNIITDAGGSITSCSSASLNSEQKICEDMGCSFNVSNNPACSCETSQIVCPKPGMYPVGFKNGLADCRTLGGGTCSGPEEYIVGVGVEKIFCGIAPNNVAAPPNIDCVATWSNCSSGSQTYNITTNSSGSGVACEAANGSTRACSANCSAANLSWTVSGNTCNGSTTTSTTDGSSANVSSTNGNTGSATFSCNSGTFSATPTSATCNVGCPAGTSTTGLGETSSGSCKCNNTGELWTGSACFSGCRVSHPIVWFQGVGFGAHGCAEYYLAPTGNFSISYMANNEVRSTNSGYCSSNSPCYGSLNYRCQNGSLVNQSLSCQGGIEP